MQVIAQTWAKVGGLGPSAALGTRWQMLNRRTCQIWYVGGCAYIHWLLYTHISLLNANVA